MLKLSKTEFKILLSNVLYNFVEHESDKGMLIFPENSTKPEVGMEVYIYDENGNKVPAKSDSYIIEDGLEIKIVDGKITEVIEPVEQPIEQPVIEEELKEEEVKLEEIVENNIKEEELNKLKLENEELKNELNLLKTKNLEFSAENEELKKRTLTIPVVEQIENDEQPKIFNSKLAQKIYKNFSR
jgi:hypothetical protein